MKIQLQHAVEYDGVTYRELRVRRPRERDRRAHLDQPLFERGMLLSARLCRVPTGVMSALSDSDLDQLNAAIEALTEESGR